MGLYPATDTLNTLTEKPMYFITTDETGNFQINNIKNGKYYLLAFKDQNQNLTFEPKTEAFGFLADTINLQDSLTAISIPIQRQNVTNFRQISSRPLGNYFEIRYSKSPEYVTLDQDFFYHIITETDNIRFYRPEGFELSHSLRTVVTVTDSTGLTLTDTITVKFNESVRRPDPFKGEPSQIDPLLYPQQFSVTFTKPVKYFNDSLVSLMIDSTLQYALTPTPDYNWNHNRTQLQFEYKVDTSVYFTRQQERYDSLYQQFILNPPDSLASDTAYVQNAYAFAPTRDLSFSYPSGTFVSVEDDTLKTLNQPMTIATDEDFGVLFLNVSTIHENYILQLIDKSYNVILEREGAPNMRFDYLIPKEYGFRFLIDSDGDGEWSQGNFYESIAPEPVYIHPEFTSLRANWEVTIDIVIP